MKKRLFIAIPLSDYFLDIFSNYSREYEFPGLRWIPRENLHITVCFLGNVLEDNISSLIAELKKEYVYLKPFELEFQKICFAPFHRNPNMVWAVFFDSQEYNTLVEKTYRAVDGFIEKPFQKKKSIIHITMGRFKNSYITHRLLLKQPNLKYEILKVSECHLMQSKLTPNGSIYSIVERFVFR